jgi:hypothetical protein
MKIWHQQTGCFMTTWTCGTCHRGVEWCWACGYGTETVRKFGCRCGVAAVGTCALCGEGILETDHFAAGLPGTWMAHEQCVGEAGRLAALRLWQARRVPGHAQAE